jgi:hypothetical protein
MTYDDSKTVSNAGTRVPLKATRIMACTVTVTARVANTGNIYLGGLTIAAGRGKELVPGMAFTFPLHIKPIYDLNAINIDADVNGEGVDYVYERP